jgi:hypothetical protein
VFKLDHPMATVIKYTAIDGTSHEISPNTDCQELWLRGSERPNGKRLKSCSLSFTSVVQLGFGSSFVPKNVVSLESEIS